MYSIIGNAVNGMIDSLGQIFEKYFDPWKMLSMLPQFSTLPQFSQLPQLSQLPHLSLPALKPTNNIRKMVEIGNVDVVTALLENGADVHADDDYILRSSILNAHLEITAKLLEYGANLHCNNNEILYNLHNSLDEQLADVILPYCNPDDYNYFWDDYIKRKIMSNRPY